MIAIAHPAALWLGIAFLVVCWLGGLVWTGFAVSSNDRDRVSRGEGVFIGLVFVAAVALVVGVAAYFIWAVGARLMSGSSRSSTKISTCAPRSRIRWANSSPGTCTPRGSPTSESTAPSATRPSSYHPGLCLPGVQTAPGRAIRSTR